ncbi:Multidrug-efflux transporter [Bacteroidales bacterium Barb6XT]|nr:Multidrug-efflux transporter [Bacteroidales bacterium Barb6XT]
MQTNKQIWGVSYPIFLSLLAQNAINVTDTAFLGRVGEVELGASAMGGLFYICCITIAFGFTTGSQIVIARRNGEGNYRETGPVMIQGVLFLLALAAFLFTLSRLFMEDIMGVMISSDKIMQAATDFLDIRVFGFFFSFGSMMFRALFVGITRTKMLTLNAILTALVNVVLDYLLIFGNFGFPEMGIKGAAIASVIAEAVSILFFLIYTRLTVDIRKYGLDRFRSFDFALLKRVLDISIFSMMQYFVSMSTFFLFFMIVERLGQRELAIANIVRSVYIVLFIPVHSLSTTANTFVSNAIGAGASEQVIPIIRKLSRLSFAVMTVWVAFVCLMPHAIVSVYTNDPQLIADSVPSLYIISIAILLSAVCSIVFNGLSGTGNTRAAFLLELVTLFFYCLFLYVIGLQMHQPVHVCFTAEILYFVLLLSLCLLYFRHARWQDKKI